MGLADGPADGLVDGEAGEEDLAEAEAVVRRALAKDRDDRFPDVASFTSALAEALGAPSAEAPRPWIPLDPELTQPGARPEPTDRLDAAGELPPPPATTSRRRRRWPWLVAGVLALALGAGAGWAAERAVSTERTLDDVTGTLAVTVPETWTAEVEADQWTPPGSDQDFPALAAGASPGWNTDQTPAPGVFVGILEGTKLPTQVPGHPECDGSRGPVLDERGGDSYMTVVFSGCPGADVTVERVVQLNASQLLWVQVRSSDRRTANRVLDSVTTFGT